MKTPDVQLSSVTGTAESMPQTINVPLLDQTSILFERDGGLTECYIPADLIDHEEVPVKEEWAASIARQMREMSAAEGGTGQKTPIRVGWIEGEDKFRIIDGFHRDAALIANGETEVYATVERVTWDSLYDQRIFTAKDHAHVRFSRVVKWIQEVWEYSGLSEKLSVEQAILIYRYGTDGSKLGVNAEEAEAAKQWVARKETQWDTAAMTIHSYLKTAESVDPMLVNATREKKNSKALKAPTQQIIKIFSDMLPHNFELQNMVWQEAKSHNLKGLQVKALCKFVYDKDADEARAAIKEIDVAEIEPLYAETQNKQLRRASDPRHKGAAALKGAATDIDRVMQRVKLSLKRDEAVDPGMSEKLDETLSQIDTLQTRLGALAINIKELRKKAKPAASETASTPRAQIEKAYKQHQQVTLANAGREPPERGRRYMAIELPTFGRLNKEDWGSLEPHHQFALVLDHPAITTERFTSRIDFWNKVLEVSKIMAPSELPLPPRELARTIQPYIKALTEQAPLAVGPIIELKEKDGSNQAVLTEAGHKYLSEVVRNALLSVDDSKD